MNKFKGWTKVFSFSFSQLTKAKSFAIATVLIAVISFAGLFLYNVISSDDSSDKEDISSINTIILSDESGFSNSDYSMIKSLNDVFKKTEIKYIKEKKSDSELVKEAFNQNENSMAIRVKKEEKNFLIEAIIPEESSLSEDDGEFVCSMVKVCFENNRVLETNLSDEQMAAISTNVSTKVTTLGEGEESIVLMLVRMFAPMLFGLIIYMMVIFYGQSIAKGMMEEKTSRILETMLTSIKSYALITGKVVAMITGAVLQILIWILSGVVGNIVGVSVVRSSNPDYSSDLTSLLNLLKENNAASAFSPAASALSLIIIVLGFVMFCVIAGAVGSFVNRAEDMSSIMMWFQYAVVIGFFIPYFGSLQENATLVQFGRYFPLCIPFSVPADVLVGSVTIYQAIVSIVILLVVCIIVILFAGKAYNAMVLYNGDKVKLKDIPKILKS